MDEQRATDLLRIASAAFNRAQGYFSLCQDLAENFYPLRADFTSEFTLGNDFATGVMDGFTISSRETLGNAIDSMLRQGDWFKIGTGDEQRDKRAVNAVALNRLTSLFKDRIINAPRTGFQRATKEGDHDWVTFGNPVFSWEEAPTRDHMILRSWHPKLVAWMTDDAGRINAAFRKVTMQARNIERKFKTGSWRGTMHQAVKDACRDDPAREFQIMHVVMPSDEVYGWSARDMKRVKHRFISLYLDVTNQEILNELGTPVFPYVIPRYRTVSNFVRGFSPMAINSLPDGRMLQSIAAVVLEQGEKALDPPMVGDQNVFKNDINLYAGGFTSIDLGEKQDIREVLTTVNTSQGMSAGVELKNDVRALLTEHWLLNKLFLPNVREMTAYEAGQRVDEFRRAALPFFNPIDSEYHSPLLSSGLEMAFHLGYLPVDLLPDELQGKEVVWSFESPLKDAEGQKVVAAFNTSVQIIAAGANAEPGLAKQFNIAEAAIDAVMGAGAKPQWIKPERERQAQKQQEQQVQQIQETAALLQQGSAAAADVSAAKMAVESAGIV